MSKTFWQMNMLWYNPSFVALIACLESSLCSFFAASDRFYFQNCLVFSSIFPFTVPVNLLRNSCCHIMIKVHTGTIIITWLHFLWGIIMRGLNKNACSTSNFICLKIYVDRLIKNLTFSQKEMNLNPLHSWILFYFFLFFCSFVQKTNTATTTSSFFMPPSRNFEVHATF